MKILESVCLRVCMCVLVSLDTCKVLLAFMDTYQERLKALWLTGGEVKIPNPQGLVGI